MNMQMKKGKELLVDDNIMIAQSHSSLLVVRKIIHIQPFLNGKFIDVVTEDKIAHIVKYESKIIVLND